MNQIALEIHNYNFAGESLGLLASFACREPKMVTSHEIVIIKGSGC